MMLIPCVLSLLLGLCSSEARSVDGQCDSEPSPSEQGEGSRQGPALIQVQVAPAAQKARNAARASPAASRDGVACDPAEHQPSALPVVGENVSSLSAYSSLHDVVGSDGVVMISLESVSTRYAYAAFQLNRIGIRPVKLSATDGKCASSEALARGCGYQNEASCAQKAATTGTGCVSRVEQAISDSHRRALEHAYTRDTSKWTAILEDDAVPATQDGYDWNIAFSEAWAKVPEGAKIVRLSWCTQPEFTPPPERNELDAGQFTFKRSWDLMSLGGCTTAYMVHQSIIPEMLKVFPCCGAVDACFAFDFFMKPDPASDGKAYMDTVLWNMDGQNSSNWIINSVPQWGNHFGIMMQNTGVSLSTRSGAGLIQKSKRYWN